MIPSTIPGRLLPGYAQPSALPYTSEVATPAATGAATPRPFTVKALS